MRPGGVFGVLERAYGLLPGVMLLVCALLTLVDVAGRNLLRAPLQGATELTELLLVGIVFVLFPRIAWRDSHLSVDLLDTVLGQFLRRLIAVAAALMAAGLFAAMAYRLWFLAERVARFGDVTASLRLPLAPVYTGMALLAGLTAAVFVIRALALIVVPRLVPLDGVRPAEARVD